MTKTGFQNLKDSGFYDNAPYKGREVAIESLTYTEPGPLTRGIRLGGFIQVRKEWSGEIEAAFADKKSLQEALDAAVERGNAAITKFARLYKGKSLP